MKVKKYQLTNKEKTKKKNGEKKKKKQKAMTILLTMSRLIFAPHYADLEFPGGFLLILYL